MAHLSDDLARDLIMSSHSSILQLECDTKSDPWGRVGAYSLAARFAQATPGVTFKYSKTEPYSEMWMGSYPSLPSRLLQNGEELQKHLDENADRLIGPKVLAKFGKDLPFIPKILSIAKVSKPQGAEEIFTGYTTNVHQALPLQIHPNKDLAAKLHQKDSEKFTDSNHKPEIAIALGDFEAFVGWKPLADVEMLFNNVDIPKHYIPVENTKDGKWTDQTLKGVVNRLLKLDETQVKELYKKLTSVSKEQWGKESKMQDLLPRLADQYGSKDRGSLVAVLCMNFLTLKRGESLYIPADGIHAYLSGDILECMARSDNMLATGFCPEAEKDKIDLFTDAVTYDYKSPETCMLKPEKAKKGKLGKTMEYAPPLSEFKVLLTKLEKGEKEEIEGIDGPGILCVTKGKGRISGVRQDLVVKEGYVFFVGQGIGLELVADDDSMDGLESHFSVCEL